MSEQLRHKMINFEATPPNAVWEAIAARIDDDKAYAVVAEKLNSAAINPPDTSWGTVLERLNDDKQFASFSSRINNAEVTPPVTAWDAITVRLDDDYQYTEVATKINNAEVTPPHSAWEAINARLNDDGQHAAMAGKMNNFETPPPAQVWNNITAALEEEKTATTPVVNLRRTIYRIAAAAVVLVFFVGGWMLINKKDNNINIAKEKVTNPSTANSKNDDNNITQDNRSDNKETAVAAIEQPAQSNPKKHNTSGVTMYEDDNDHQLKHAVVDGLLAYQEKPIIISSSPILDSDGNIIRDMDVLTTSNYIMVTGPNGQATRISSKFANVIRYLNTSSNDPEEYLDKVIKESDTWKKRFQEWRSKISQSSFIPSSSNFLDIIEFKDLIQEKQ